MPPPTQLNNHVTTGAEWAEILADIAPGWTAYTPVWTSSGTAPAIGNGTLTGRYRSSQSLDLAIVEIFQIWGSTTTSGTGVYQWSCPIAPSADSIGGGCGDAIAYDAGTIWRPGSAQFIGAGTALEIFVGVSGDGHVGATVPQTWAVGDWIKLRMEFEPATW